MLDPPDRPPLLNPTSTTNQTIQPTQISESQATSSNRKRPPNRGSRGRGRGNHGNSHRPVDQTQSHESINNNVLEGSTHGSTVTNTPAEAESSQRANTPKRGGRGGSARRGSRGGNRSHGFRGHAEPKDSDGRSTADETGEKDGADAVSDPNAQQPKGPSRSARRRQFGSKLTTTDDNATPTPTEHSSGGHRRTQSSNKNATAPSTQSKDMDLTSRLTAAFSRTASPDDAPDCPICFSTIGPGNPTWSCSPTLDGSDPLHDEHGVCCWTSFHLKCIKSWAAKSTKETREAYLAREVDNVGEWRCPGCQTRRSVVPRDYRCFCGRVIDPKPGRLATPHSCGDACSRRRITCEHPCPLPCHPGPCPPCLLTITQQCHCGAQTLSLRCSNVTASGQDPSKQRSVLAPLSCGKTCGRPLSCGKHFCKVPCHPGPCSECEIIDTVKCYCGKEQQEMKCGDGEAKACTIRQENGLVMKWDGRFDCHRVCDRSFDCGQHQCKKTCHPPSLDPAPCPRSPSLVTTCPCAAMSLSALSVPPRTACTDPIPTCGLICSKPQQLCDHLCERKCHEGPCGRCRVTVEEKCRCGRIGRQRKCWEVEEARQRLADGTQEFDEDEGVFTCDKKCTVPRNCGKHICGRICCPLAALAGVLDGGKGKKKQREIPSAQDLAELDPEGWHICDLVCNKSLSCGNHNCAENDHRGPCPPCLQSSFEELTCACGRTTIMPPVPCGTIMKCPYPCARPPPPCGHPKSPHNCHEDEDGCPPCPFLTTKTCSCGKSEVRNVRCSQDRVSCGMPCGKLLDCGFHSCDKLCHTGECGSCTQVCGKSRKLCLPLNHPCTQTCHAPSACPETEPCKAIITLKCACGRLQQPATCGISTTSPTSRANQPLPCLQDCLVAKRNERLASALGISPDRRSPVGNEAKYSESLQTFFKANSAFAAMVEKNLNDFITSSKRMVVLAPMPPPRRKFVRELAEVYRLDTEEVDQEPRRSVQLLRRIDSRIPNPLLSAAVRPVPTGKQSGLVALKRTGVNTPPIASTSNATPSSSVPVKMAWGTRPANVAQPSPSSTPAPSTSITLAASFAAMNVTPPVSRPRTPPVTSQVPTIASAPIAGFAPEEVPESWEED